MWVMERDLPKRKRIRMTSRVRAAFRWYEAQDAGLQLFVFFCFVIPLMLFLTISTVILTMTFWDLVFTLLHRLAG